VTTEDKQAVPEGAEGHVHGPIAAGYHGVQFYENDGALCDTVGAYVGSGLGGGERVVVIATKEHKQGIVARLSNNAIDVELASRSGRLVLLDARETLARFMDGAMPDAERFREVIGGVLGDAAATRVRAYGEMVDVLWMEGNVGAALYLEELWNRLAKEHPFSLLCSYLVTQSAGQGPHQGFEEVRRVHNHELPMEGASGPEDADARMREIGFLQKRARALEDEIRQRRQLEIALRDALLDREQLLVEVEADRVRLCESEERQFVQRARLELLQAITASFSRALKPCDIAEIIVQQGTAVLGAPSGGIWLLAEGTKTLELVRSTGFTSTDLERYSRLDVDSPMPIARCHHDRSEVWIESRSEYARDYPEAAAQSAEAAELALICLPLQVESRCFGAFSMAFARSRKFTRDERTFLVTVAHHAAQAFDRARLFEEAERVQASLRFLSEASSVLAGSLDYDETLAAVARLAVPWMADWATIDMLRPDGTFRRVAVAHADPQKVDLGWELSRRQPATARDSTGPASVVRTGKPEVFEEIPDSVLAQSISDPEVLRIIRDLGFVSSMCIPLSVGGRPVGAITFVAAESQRHFRASDLALAEELARRASMAIDNARAYREAQDANRLKDEFLATMSHELRTPLNAILGWSTMLRTKPGVDMTKALDTIERNARAQVRLIDEVLDISRIMNGKLRLDLQSIDLANVLRASVDVVAPSALAKGITLEVEAVGPCPFYGDSGRLQQVFWNLLSNAIKFTSKGGRVQARLARSGSQVELTIADNGRGIRADFLPVMFQRFRQADSSTTRTEGGLGIGLAIVGHLVQLHGGTVSARSAGEGQGATFTLLLPIRVLCTEEPRLTPVDTVLSKPLAGLRILVCEDDADSRALLQELLSSEGATVRLAAAAGEAIDHLREFRPDVFVSDIGLPVVDGYTLIRQIRQLSGEQGGWTPAIALTAYAGAEDARRAFEAGFQSHMTKPVDPSELAARVAAVARRAGAPTPS
jgi:signal transduction histidine kinase/ActR/RegA family two-component response regulator